VGQRHGDGDQVRPIAAGNFQHAAGRERRDVEPEQRADRREAVGVARRIG